MTPLLLITPQPPAPPGAHKPSWQKEGFRKLIRFLVIHTSIHRDGKYQTPELGVLFFLFSLFRRLELRRDNLLHLYDRGREGSDAFRELLCGHGVVVDAQPV